MVFPLVEHIPYWTFNHIIKSKLRHLVIKGYCSRAYQCLVSRIQRGLGQLGFLVQISVTALSACISDVSSGSLPSCMQRVK